MSALNHRRGFLRGLVSLPLIGGGVTLIGAPTAVATPATDALLMRYADWLAAESTAALRELEARPLSPADVEAAHYRRRWTAAAFKVNPLPLSGPTPVLHAPASERAALVLSAVGLDWRGAGR